MTPFPGGWTETANGTVLFSLVAAFLYLFMTRREPSWRRTVAKTAAVGLLALLSVLQGGPWALTAALAFGAMGDAFLAQKGENAFAAGLGSFLVAHLFYVALFIDAGATPASLASPARLAAIVVLGVLAAFVLRRVWRRAGPLRFAVAAYVGAILAMGQSALALPGDLVIATAGALMFVASDAILAEETFVMTPDAPAHAWASPAVWLLYYGAQAAIALTFLS